MLMVYESVCQDSLISELNNIMTVQEGIDTRQKQEQALDDEQRQIEQTQGDFGR